MPLAEPRTFRAMMQLPRGQKKNTRINLGFWVALNFSKGTGYWLVPRRYEDTRYT